MRKSKQAKIEPCTLMIICFLDIREAFWMVPRGQDPLKLKYMHFVAFMDLSSSNHPIFGTSIDHIYTVQLFQKLSFICVENEDCKEAYNFQKSFSFNS